MIFVKRLKIVMKNKAQIIEWEKLDNREKRLMQYVADYHLFKRIFIENISNEDMVKIFIEYVDSMWGEDFHGKYLQVTVIPEGMECDHMFVDDYYEGINLFPITRIEATKRLAYLQSHLNDTKNYFTFNIACFEVEWCVVHDTVLLKLERLNTKLIDL